MKGIIVYKGKYGATRQYAEWIGEELQLPALTPDSLDLERLAISDFVVIGGSVYMGEWLTRRWLKQHENILKNKKLFLFVVCGTPSSEKQKQEHIAKYNVPAQILDRSPIFFLPGRLVMKQLSWKDRLMIKLGARMEKNPVKKKAILQGVDGVR